ncbi:MAG: hypothetical protein Q8O62_01830 [Aequorivita sp.]|nr:hypothetical protein [Aequorivita sp.]
MTRLTTNQIKNLVILTLSLGLLVLYVFSPSNKVDTSFQKEQIEVLNQQNIKLLKSNDSLDVVNSQLDYQIAQLNDVIQVTNGKLIISNSKLKDLTEKQTKIKDLVNKIPDNQIANELSKYLNRRDLKNN